MSKKEQKRLSDCVKWRWNAIVVVQSSWPQLRRLNKQGEKDICLFRWACPVNGSKLTGSTSENYVWDLEEIGCMLELLWDNCYDGLIRSVTFWLLALVREKRVLELPCIFVSWFVLLDVDGFLAEGMFEFLVNMKLACFGRCMIVCVPWRCTSSGPFFWNHCWLSYQFPVNIHLHYSFTNEDFASIIKLLLTFLTAESCALWIYVECANSCVDLSCYSCTGQVRVLKCIN